MTDRLGRNRIETVLRTRLPQRARRAGWLIPLALVAAGWYLLAPPVLGGSTNYVVTSGPSMLPTVHGNALVLTRTSDSYRIGDVVAYHNRRLHEVVLHRIVARDGDRYVFKGDNNDFTDPYHPTAQDLVGKKWIYLPGGGRLLLNLRTPWVGAVVLGLLGMWAFAERRPQKSRHRRRRVHA